MNEVNNDISIFTNQPISFAMCYVPYQTWDKTYDLNLAYFNRGTIFPCLDKPFIGEEGPKDDR